VELTAHTTLRVVDQGDERDLCTAGAAGSLRWLGARTAELQWGDPLAPVMVAFSSSHIGLATGRSLARTGYANVRFGVMGRLVEPLGAPALARPAGLS
jgi:hypothetical protein